jgi:hypothetical protein
MICKLLAQNKSIKYICLKENSFNQEGLNVFLLFLKENYIILEKLNLKKNSIQFDKVDEKILIFLLLN